MGVAQKLANVVLETLLQMNFPRNKIILINKIIIIIIFLAEN